MTEALITGLAPGGDAYSHKGTLRAKVLKPKGAAAKVGEVIGYMEAGAASKDARTARADGRGAWRPPQNEAALEHRVAVRNHHRSALRPRWPRTARDANA